jgi:hypothetical protein
MHGTELKHDTHSVHVHCASRQVLERNVAGPTCRLEVCRFPRQFYCLQAWTLRSGNHDHVNPQTLSSRTSSLPLESRLIEFELIYQDTRVSEWDGRPKLAWRANPLSADDGQYASS